MLLYRGKFVLAPMVRCGELPTRLVALAHGADLVWGPEIIDRAIVKCTRVERDGGVEWVAPSQNKGKTSTTVFRTVPQERGRVVFQLGTADPVLAVEAASMVVKDVAAIDINAGCPKHFSVHAGMGAALLLTPDKLVLILTLLVREVGTPNDTPISVKIRILQTEQETLALVLRLVKTGIANLTVHCRRREMRNREAPIRDYLPGILALCREAGVTCIVNGRVTSHQEYVAIQEKYGEDVGAMVAEAAEVNPSVFSQSPLRWQAVVREYMETAKRVANPWQNTKYCLGRMIPGKHGLYQVMCRAKGEEEQAALLQQVVEEVEALEALEKEKEQQEQQEEQALGKEITSTADTTESNPTGTPLDDLPLPKRQKLAA